MQYTAYSNFLPNKVTQKKYLVLFKNHHVFFIEFYRCRKYLQTQETLKEQEKNSPALTYSAKSPFEPNFVLFLIPFFSSGKLKLRFWIQEGRSPTRNRSESSLSSPIIKRKNNRQRNLDFEKKLEKKYKKVTVYNNLAAFLREKLACDEANPSLPPPPPSCVRTQVNKDRGTALTNCFYGRRRRFPKHTFKTTVAQKEPTEKKGEYNNNEVRPFYFAPFHVGKGTFFVCHR